MLSLIEALNFRALRYVRQPLGRFHVLVGPNASGKTTFLDVPALLGRLVSDGLEAAIGERTQNFSDLTWHREGRSVELAIEAVIPEELSLLVLNGHFDTIRYEVRVGFSTADELSILEEQVLLVSHNPFAKGRAEPAQQERSSSPRTILTSGLKDGEEVRWYGQLADSTHEREARFVIRRSELGRARFFSEMEGLENALPFRFGPQRSALGNLPEDESQFPISTWLKRTLTTGVQQLILNSLLLRKASPPGQARRFKPDGSNLPWVVADLEDKSPERLQEWVAHLRTALPELEGIRTVERGDDRHRYLMLRYQGGLEVPSWMASDGTLRLLALTLPAYLPDFHGTYLIEEPENGIHPRAVETMFQSLSSVYDAQILLATHSPVILSIVDVKDVLCFTKTSEGATAIVPGNEHPALKDWKGETNLGTLFAAGVLG